MNWNLLKVFLALAETGSLSGAARLLGINHSTAFRQLQAIEAETGGKLFERHDAGYELSALGQELLETARNIEGRFHDIERQIVGKDFQPRGTVRITAPHNIAYRYLPRYLRNFARTYPEIRIEILVSNLEFNMNNRQADIAVRATNQPPGHLIGRNLGRIGWGVYAGSRYQSDRSPKSLAQLKGNILVSACGDLSALPAYRMLEDEFQNDIHIRCDDMVAMASFAEQGRALVMLPDDQERPGLKKLFELPAEFTSHLWLLTHPDLRNTQRVRVVMENLQQAFAAEHFLAH